jgi:polysaccharide biosynthesis/export protein
MQRLKIIIGIAVSALVSGCATPQYPNFFKEDQIVRPYTLASGDRLRIIVFGQNDLSNSYSVDGSGKIAMPLIGSVPAEGRTVAELSDEIATKLRNGLLRDPKVSAEVEAYRPFFILGEVGKAGQYPYVNGMTVETAVAIAGGFSPHASRTTANVTRLIDGKPIKATVPIDQAVLPGDNITITERFP